MVDIWVKIISQERIDYWTMGEIVSPTKSGSSKGKSLVYEVI